MKNKRTNGVVIRFILALTALAFSPQIANGASKTAPVVEISVDTGKVINTMRGGIGASWHAIENPIPVGHRGSAWGAYPPAEDEHAWQQIYRHASWTGTASKSNSASMSPSATGSSSIRRR